MLSTSTIIDRIDYSEYSNAKLLALPLILLGIAILILVAWYMMTGAPVILGVEFTGGSEIRIAAPSGETLSNQEIANTFDTEPSTIQQVPTDGTYIITFTADADVSELEDQAESAGYTVRSSSSIAPSFGSGSQQLTLIGMLGAFVGMSLIVFGLFRTFIPSVAVVASAFSDLVIPLALMNLLQIELTLGTVAALLMLLGYSVDSDMLLNDYVVRRRGEFYDAVYTAMDTGLTMTLTSFIAMSIMAIGGFLLGVPLLQDIGMIIAFGLAVDVMNTYLMNVTLLRWYRFNRGGA